MPESIENVLEICLQKIQHKSATIEDCLTEFPEHRQELQEMLPLMLSLQSFKQVKPSPQFARDAANRMVSRLPDLPVTFWGRLRLNLQKQTFLHNRRIKMPQIIVSVILAIGLLFGGSFAVEASGPGDLLYELDRSVEQIRLKLTTSPEKATTLRMQNASERLEEAYKKVQKGDIENAVKALENYNKALEEIKANQDGQVREETRTMTQEEGALQAGTLDRIRLSQPEDAQARNALQQELQRANMGLEQLFGPPEEAPQGPTEEAPQGPASEDAQGPSEDAPQGPKEDAPQGPTDGAPNGSGSGKP